MDSNRVNRSPHWGQSLLGRAKLMLINAIMHAVVKYMHVRRICLSVIPSLITA